MRQKNKTPKKITLREIYVENAFTSINDMWLYNYDKFRQTLDLNWFIDGYDGRQKKLDYKLLEPIEAKITEEYELKLNDSSMQSRNQKFAKVKALTLKYEAVTALIRRMAKGFDATPEAQAMRKQFIDRLKKWGFTMPIMANPNEDLERLTIIATQINGVKTQINIIMDELKVEGKKESIALSKQLKIVSIALQIGHQLNSKKITIEDWLDYGELLQEQQTKK